MRVDAGGFVRLDFRHFFLHFSINDQDRKNENMNRKSDIFPWKHFSRSIEWCVYDYVLIFFLASSALYVCLRKINISIFLRRSRKNFFWRLSSSRTELKWPALQPHYLKMWWCWDPCQSKKIKQSLIAGQYNSLQNTARLTLMVTIFLEIDGVGQKTIFGRVHFYKTQSSKQHCE